MIHKTGLRSDRGKFETNFQSLRSNSYKRGVFLLFTTWTLADDRMLCRWLNKGRQKGWKWEYMFCDIARKLQRTVAECQQRFQQLQSNPNTPFLEYRMMILEEVVESQQNQLTKMLREIEQSRAEYKYMESIVFEQNQLLLRLIGEENRYLRIHSG